MSAAIGSGFIYSTLYKEVFQSPIYFWWFQICLFLVNGVLGVAHIRRWSYESESSETTAEVGYLLNKIFFQIRGSYKSNF